VELFRDVNIDWLGKKWYFLGFSLIFSVAGVLSMLFWHHIPLSIDVKGGTQITVPFDAAPNVDDVRTALSRAQVQGFTICQP
jgi:preprotein translocase subunit SecF